MINFLTCTESKNCVESFCSSLEKRDLMYCETSRFIIDEQHRSLSLSAFFVSSMVAICNSINISYCFFQCDPHHTAFYKKFGIKLFPGLDSFETLCYGKRVVIFGAVIEALQLYQSSIVQFTKQFLEERQISFSRAA